MANPKIICCAVTAIIIIILVIIFTTLAFTVFKPKRPFVNLHPIDLDKIQWGLTPNVTLTIVITIQNRNHADFKFVNGTARVHYHGLFVSEVPIPGHTVRARSKINITTSADLMASEIVNSPYFIDDVVSGSLNLTSTSKLAGKAIFVNVFKKHATVYTGCNISVLIVSQTAESNCLSELKF